ncbi:hypothetical protein MOV08_00625 [Streptomyces yunnanensis]|uniref:Uncharacterized protein n=1 Tax=Streptomyces yunnanensis TaxID=156453 RepID=A0ABY7ZZC4_9ACTN|nr:hypothetical protein [Streptomyces yunnanensis]WEB37963.1 hypothetical protein MOV08_00625 [Streptomyces yunnanensis]
MTDLLPEFPGGLVGDDMYQIAPRLGSMLPAWIDAVQRPGLTDFALDLLGERSLEGMVKRVVRRATGESVAPAAEDDEDE